MTVLMLDFQSWIHPATKEDEGDKIRYLCYEKPKTSPIVFHGERSHAWRNKLVVLAQETLRRMINCDRWTTPETRILILTKFAQKLADSGYRSSTRRETTTSGLTKYYRPDVIISDQILQTGQRRRGWNQNDPQVYRQT